MTQEQSEVKNSLSETNVENGPSEQKIQFGRYEKIRIIKNVSILGFAFMIHFTAFHGTSNLQSSVHVDPSLGTFTLAAIYGSLILSNIFLPVMVISWLGCKWTIVVSFIAYMPYIASQLYPSFYTSIPAGLAVGFGGGPLWCAKCTYLSIIAEAYCTLRKRKKETDHLIVKFFGIFFVFYQLAQVFGNFISYSVLSHEDPQQDSLNALMVNHSLPIKNISDICGANFYPGVHTADENPNLQRPDQFKLNVLWGIFLGCMALASLSVAFGVDSLKRYNLGRQGSGHGITGMKLLVVTVKQLAQKYQLLLLPITMFIGVEQAFVAVDFTASFVACGLGIQHIGFAMICFGLANAFAAGITPTMAKLLGRYPLILFVAIFHTGLIAFMASWQANDNYYVYCIMAACWGMADGIWLIKINALSGILFPGKEEAAFSNFRLWEATGSVITYLLSPMLGTYIKLILVNIIMIVGVICYSFIELSERRIKRGIEGQKFEPVSQIVDKNGKTTEEHFLPDEFYRQ